MARGKPGGSGFASYSCSDRTWQGILTIARSFGWVASGTVPDPCAADRNNQYADYFKPTYDAEEWGFCKQVACEDAVALAASLRRAAAAIREGKIAIIEPPGPPLLKDDLSAEELKRVNSLPTQQLETFAQFAEGGAFAFAWDD